MKILVTGLCLSRNLGGPAMGLTLVEELWKRLGDDVEFVFAVVSEAYIQEKLWADRYHLRIVRRDNLYSWLRNNNILIRICRVVKKWLMRNGHIPYNAYKEIHHEYMSSFEWSDVVIDMMGIAYAGDGVRGLLEGINSYTNYYYSNKNNKPYSRFIQSFGPFDDWKVRIFAKKEFKSATFIPARGKNSAAYCRKLVNDKSIVYDFPDSAILLPCNYKWAEEYLDEHGLEKMQYVVISPSAVIYNSVKQSAGGSVGEKHIESYIKICESLIDNNEVLLFLPHMYSNRKNECDREVARKVASNLSGGNFLIVEEDIDPMQAKALISSSKYSIVSRYHALVAALSSGTNVITIGWNIKYQDLMEYYGAEKYAVDVRMYGPDSLFEKVMSLIDEISQKGFMNDYLDRNKLATKQVEAAFDMLAEWVKNEA